MNEKQAIIVSENMGVTVSQLHVEVARLICDLEACYTLLEEKDARIKELEGEKDDGNEEATD